MLEFGKVTIEGQPLTICYSAYANRRIAIQSFTTQGEPWARLSVNIPESDIGENEFAFDANNNERNQQDWLDSGHFQDTGRVAKSGYCTYPIWRITTTID
jgi:hypothetical protein